MSEETLITYCSPTLAGLKTASLFCMNYASGKDLVNDLKELNGRFSEKGLRFIPLKIREGRVWIYVFRPSCLMRDLENEEAQKILKSLGYPEEASPQFLTELFRRMKNEKAFPHEIGLFLGYPPEDVRGFMQYRGKKSKLTGDWKVYGDEKKAWETFRKFDICRKAYKKCFLKGMSIEQLTVAV